jgi:hypothetical protein
MESVGPSEWLSAADCASRTGLTARALRVCEEFGLIAPRRSAAGWRQSDQYDLDCERGTSSWRISLSADDKIVAANLDWDCPNSAAGPQRT